MSLLSQLCYCMCTKTLILYFECKQDGKTEKQTDGHTVRWPDVPITIFQIGPYRPGIKRHVIHHGCNNEITTALL